MTDVLALDPHGDDLALFAAYTCLREKPHVIVPLQTVPNEEMLLALAILGCTCEVWRGEADTLEHDLRTRYFPTRVFAPEIHDEGHVEHNLIGVAAIAAFGMGRVSRYPTYAPRGTRQRGAIEIIPTGNEIAMKLRALSCFESQAEQSSTRPWFYDLLDMREWLT